jgi:heme exporter protein B
MLRQTWAIFAKDIRMEFRGKEALNAAIAFALVILILFSFVIDPTSEELKEFSGGLLWLLFAFSGVLLLNRSFSREQANDTLDVLLGLRVRPAALLLGKALANLVFILLVEVVCLPVFGVLYNIDVFRQPLWLAGTMLFASWAIAVTGTVFAAMTVNLRLRELMLPVIVYPMIVPALAAAIRLTTLALQDQVPSGGDLIWARLLLGYDIIFTALAAGLMDSVLLD